MRRSEDGGSIEHLEVGATHVGLGCAEVYRVVAQRLVAREPSRSTGPEIEPPAR